MKRVSYLIQIFFSATLLLSNLSWAEERTVLIGYAAPLSGLSSVSVQRNHLEIDNVIRDTPFFQ